MHGAPRRLPSRIKQESRNSPAAEAARIISVSNKIQRQTLAGNARFLLHPPSLPPTLLLSIAVPRCRYSSSFSSSSSRRLLFSSTRSRSNSRSLLLLIAPSSPLPPTNPPALPSPSAHRFLDARSGALSRFFPRSSAGETLHEITLNIYLRDDCSRRTDGINIIM